MGGAEGIPRHPAGTLRRVDGGLGTTLPPLAVFEPPRLVAPARPIAGHLNPRVEASKVTILVWG